jgi:type 1 fimbriae regulatory protein FimB/type 1 fimbriae regulatory protein FimE
MEKSALRLVTPPSEKWTVPSEGSKPAAVRPKNGALRTREYLTPDEVKALMAAARENRHGHRDATMILIAYRHGLRATEVASLQWDQIDFKAASIYVRRAKNGISGNHPLRGDELRALRQLQRDWPGEFVFQSERGTPFTTVGFAKMVARAGAKLGSIKVHAHMLRHSCGYYLANHGVDTRTIQGYLGHKNINHTVLYTQLAPNRFKDLWRD